MKKKDRKRRAEVMKFTQEEQKKMSVWFELEVDGHEMEDDLFNSKWGDFMNESVKSIWMKYLFPNGTPVNLARFTYLYKGQTQMFMDLRATAIYRVIQQIDPVIPVTTSLDVNVLKDYSEGIISSYLRCLGSFENEDFMKWTKMQAKASSRQLKAFNEYIFAPLINQGDKVEVRIFELWLRMNRSFVELITGLMDVCYGFQDIGTTPGLLPRPKARWPTVLDVSHIFFLQSQLTKHSTKRWRMRFHNGGNGNNYTMLSNLIVNVGPTIIVIRDHGGNIFGCFASESWAAATSFYGDIRSFIFQLTPTLKKFEASGYNYHFQYHNQLHHALPNGFGMGGQINFWGLWIDADFGKGMCSEFCSTFRQFERPSSSENFTFDHIEVWSVNEDEGYSSQQALAYSQSKGSFMSTVSSASEVQEARALLRMAGKEMDSQYKQK